MKDDLWEKVEHCLPVWNSAIVPSSDVRLSETSVQNARGKNFQKFMCSNFRGFVFRGSNFHVLVVGCKNHENLDLAKISCYTVNVYITSIKGGAHTCFIGVWILDTSVQHVWAPPLAEVLHYSALDAVMCLKTQWNSVWFLPMTATCIQGLQIGLVHKSIHLFFVNGTKCCKKSYLSVVYSNSLTGIVSARFYQHSSVL